MKNLVQVLKGRSLQGLFFMLVLVLYLAGLSIVTLSADNKKLEYEVGATAQLVPFFVVDKKGNPVYDLREEEVELYVDGKLTPLLAFNRFQLDRMQGAPEQAQGQPEPAPAVKMPERINFLILDTLIGGLNTIKDSCRIAWKIIEKAPPTDGFVLLRSDWKRGFRYIMGPEKNKGLLAAALERLGAEFTEIEANKLNLRRFRRIAGQAHWYSGIEYQSMKGGIAPQGSGRAGGSGAAEEAMAMQRMMFNRGKAHEHNYIKNMKNFGRSLAQLKYALRSTTFSKSVFLISSAITGHQGAAIQNRSGENPVAYYRVLEEAGKAINYGGGLFYLVNPMPIKDSHNQGTLKFMADAAGGQYISGRSLDKIVDNLKNNTSAYYEIAFSPTGKPGQKKRIKIKLKRKGMKLTTIAHSEQDRPYDKMKKTERRMFVLNVVNGGSWSRMSTRVRRIKYTRGAGYKSVDPTRSYQDVYVKVPEDMRGKYLHFYKVDVDPKSGKAIFDYKKKKSKRREKVRLTPSPGKAQFFVFIDPKTGDSLYNNVAVNIKSNVLGGNRR